jgi:AraC-like DNA-binding protein
LAIRERAPLLERQSRLACFLALLLERFSGKTLSPGAAGVQEGGILEARDRILARYAEPLTLDDLTGDAGLSRFALVRGFTARFGISPHDYLVKVRLAKAQDLIGRGVRFAEAAAAVGFADQSHFIRHFKKVYRLTPGEFWKTHPGS